MVTWGLRCPASACSSDRQEHACDGGKDKSKVSWESLSSSGDTGGDPSAQERVQGPRGGGRMAQSSGLVSPFQPSHQGQGETDL